MDELSNRVRELAPETDASPQDLQWAKDALRSAIALEQGEKARPGRRRVVRIARAPRWRLSAGTIAAVAAVAIVAVIAAGAIVASQWLSRPDPDVAVDPRLADGVQMDLARPLLGQLDPGQFVRVAIVAEQATRYESDERASSEDSYVRVRTTTAHYLSADEAWISVSGGTPPEIIEAVGPDGEAMAAEVAIDEPPYIYEANTPSADWLGGLPSDADGLMAALADRNGSAPPETAADAEGMFWMAFLADPVWYALSSDQRKAVIDFVAQGDGTTRTTHGDRVELTLGDPVMETLVLDAQSLLPLTGVTSAGSMGGDATLPSSTFRYQYSIVDEAPDVVIPDDPATYSCNGTPIPGSVFYYSDLDAMLDENGLAAVQGEGVPSLAADEWYAVSQSADRVVLWSWVLHGQQLTDGPVPSGLEGGVTHELMTIAQSGGAWKLTDWETCVLMQELPDHEVADIALDPDFPITPESTELHFLVTPIGCSAQPAEVLELQEFDETVEVLIGIPRVDPADDGCADPVTQTLTVPLTKALGDRGIRDLTYMESRMLRGAP